jgi:hypothetical protein
VAKFRFFGNFVLHDSFAETSLLHSCGFGYLISRVLLARSFLLHRFADFRERILAFFGNLVRSVFRFYFVIKSELENRVSLVQERLKKIKLSILETARLIQTDLLACTIKLFTAVIVAIL